MTKQKTKFYHLDQRYFHVVSKKNNILEPPLRITKEEFINPKQKVDQVVEQKQKGRVQAVTFTLNNLDLETLDQQLDRAILLKRRNKNKSVVIRMALRALENASDEEYLNLYNKF